ncbi:MAG: hypothetical protein ACUVTZ_10255 [Armatimonadota bacterium]
MNGASGVVGGLPVDHPASTDGVDADMGRMVGASGRIKKRKAGCVGRRADAVVGGSAGAFGGGPLWRPA